MANHKSALKRAKQSAKKQLRNKAVKTRMRNVIKALRTAQDASPEEAEAALNLAQSVIDKAAKKGVIHKNAAARKISRLTKLVNTLAA